MLAKIEFQLPEDDLEYRKCIAASQMASVLLEITWNLRRNMEWEIESWEDELQPGATKCLEVMMERIHSLLENNDLNMDSLS